MRKPVAFSNLSIDINKYEKSAIPDIIGRLTYSNLDFGERMYGSTMALTNLERFPGTELVKKYKCEEQIDDVSY